MTTNLYAASQQWTSRPDEQRFWTTDDLRGHAEASYARSYEREDTLNKVYQADGSGDLMSGHARLSSHAFGQLCQFAGAPAGYLRSLSPHLAGRVITESALGLTKRRRVLSEVFDGVETIRAYTSTGYSRLWDTEWVEAVQRLEDRGWRVPPARKAADGMRSRIATERDVIDWGHESPLTVRVGDEISPSGLYRGDTDSFAFLVRPDVRIEDGSEGGLMRGVFLWNSEVGARSMGCTTFLLRVVCGNHIVWGASDVATVRKVHRGDTTEKLREMMVGIHSLDAASGIESDIRRLQRDRIGQDADEVSRRVATKTSMTLGEARAALEFAEAWEAVDGDPFSFWGFAQGVTRLSQESRWVSERTRLDRAAGTLLAMA